MFAGTKVYRLTTIGRRGQEGVELGHRTVLLSTSGHAVAKPRATQITARRATMKFIETRRALCNRLNGAAAGIDGATMISIDACAHNRALHACLQPLGVCHD